MLGEGARTEAQAERHFRSYAEAIDAVGRNGGGLNHYVGQEKLAPMASWAPIAFATDWGGPPRLQNAPSFHYVHSDQWRYDRAFREQINRGNVLLSGFRVGAGQAAESDHVSGKNRRKFAHFGHRLLPAARWRSR